MVFVAVKHVSRYSSIMRSTQVTAACSIRALCWLLMVLLALTAAGICAASVQAKTSTMSHWRFMVGTWTCTHYEPGYTVTSTIAATMVGPWLKMSENTRAAMGQPAKSSEEFWSYDDLNHRWVIISIDSLGNYSTGESKAGPTAAIQTYSDAFPEDPNDGPTTLRFLSKSEYVVDATWTEKGRKMSYHTVCKTATENSAPAPTGIPATPAPTPSTELGAAAPTFGVLVDLSGNKPTSSSQFAAGTSWGIAWSYDCREAPKGATFSVSVQGGRAEPLIAPQNENEASITYYHDAGDFYLRIDSRCAWHVRAFNQGQ
jgi:hypothetical protein